MSNETRMILKLEMFWLEKVSLMVMYTRGTDSILDQVTDYPGWCVCCLPQPL